MLLHLVWVSVSPSLGCSRADTADTEEAGLVVTAGPLYNRVSLAGNKIPANIVLNFWKIGHG